LRPRQEASTALLEILRLSLDSLPGEARTAFSDLGAFAPEPDWFTRESAIFVTETSPETIDLLVERHLLDADRDQLAMSQVLADVACEITSTGAAARHGDYYLQLARRYRKEPASIAPIYGQMRYAWSAAPNDARLLDWIEALSHYQEYSGQWSDYVDWAERGLQVAEELQLTHAQGVLYNNLAKIYGSLRQRERSLTFYQLALPILEEVGTRSEVALALSNLGTAYASVGKSELALTYYQRALPLLEEVGDKPALATLLNNMGKLCSDTGQRQKALQYYQRALPILVDLEDYSLESTARFNLALLYRAQGRLDQAVAEMRRAVVLEGQAGHPDLESDSALLAQLERELTTPRLIRWLRKLL
jgi:tetratricopeptide (TPR) repeat protein